MKYTLRIHERAGFALRITRAVILLVAVSSVLPVNEAASQVPSVTGCETRTDSVSTTNRQTSGAASRLRLRVNIPAYRLELFQDDSLVRRYVVAIGDTAHPTPIGRFAVTRVDWDPWWIPPASDWAKNESLTPPGPKNPMGRVRLAFQDLYFIHGTPNPHSVGTPASHGCVRLSNTNAIDLAKRVLALNAPAVSQAEVNRLAARRGRTRSIPLEQAVPFEIYYQVAVVQHGTLVVYPDVYHRLPTGTAFDSVMATLRRSLGDSVAFDSARVAQALARVKEKRVSVDANTLRVSAPAPGPR